MTDTNKNTNESNFKRMVTTINYDVDKFLRKIFVDKEIKQIQVAEKLNITRASFGGILSRSGKVSVDSLATIADAIDCDLQISFVDRKTGQEWKCKKINNIPASEVEDTTN